MYEGDSHLFFLIFGLGLRFEYILEGHAEYSPHHPLASPTPACKRNIKVSYLLQHLLRCTECGLGFRSKAKWHNQNGAAGGTGLE